MTRPAHPDLVEHFNAPTHRFASGDTHARFMCSQPEPRIEAAIGLTLLALDTLSFVSAFERGEP